jgi:lysozyme family protein
MPTALAQDVQNQPQGSPQGHAGQAPAERQQQAPPAPLGTTGGTAVGRADVPTPAASQSGMGWGAVITLLIIAAALVALWLAARRRRRH